MTVDTAAAALENAVPASASTRALIEAYVLAKDEADAALADAERAKKALHEAFDDAGAAKFLGADGRVLISRSTVTRTNLDRSILARLAPKALERATVVSEGFRVNLPRLR